MKVPKVKFSRRRMRHPEAAISAIQSRVVEKRQPYRDSPAWGACFGWLIRLDEQHGQRHYRDVAPGTSYAEAVEIRDRELYAHDSPYVSAWLMKKGFTKGFTR